MKHYRLLGILLLLENNHVMTAKALASHFEVSIRTIYRDLDVLSEGHHKGKWKRWRHITHVF